ncbi:hypothetical protein [Nocardiopsis gilva]|uniref:hypothetical protein n=1 Tax=Nocardiopsis gilva TaxID=280236 RepID=UPI0003460EDF|nr:hypothetical protein [Nocardiopsis gilva]
MDYRNDHVVAAIGPDPAEEREQARWSARAVGQVVGDRLFRARHACGKGSLDDLVITRGNTRLLVAAVRAGPGAQLCVQVRMDRRDGNLAFARRRLRGVLRPTAHTRPSPTPEPPHAPLPPRPRHPERPASGTTLVAGRPDTATLYRVLEALKQL